jgi:hypothetical protein
MPANGLTSVDVFCTFMPKNIRVFVKSAFFLAIPVALFFFFTLPDIFQKYETDVVESGLVHKKDGFEYYSDLNGDWISERVVLFNNTEGKASVKILSLQGSILDHYYFSGEIIPNPSSLFIGSFNSSSPVGIF